MMKASWEYTSTEDTEEYRKGYPEKKDHKDLDKNARFYLNEIQSKPDGDFIDVILKDWQRDYKLLERHHGYIQWLFPIRDDGLNWYAQELQLHEIEKICGDKKAHRRVLKAYKMMLDFYGMKFKDEESGKIERAENWAERFQHLNRSYHNCLRITRILKCLGELRYEYLKRPFIEFILYEAIVEETLPDLLKSCCSYWIDVLREDHEREEVWKLYGTLSEQKNKNISDQNNEDSKKQKSKDKSKKEQKAADKKLPTKKK